MATTIAQVKSLLTANSVKFRDGNSSNELVMGWTTSRYTDPDTGNKTAFLVIRLEEDGEFIKIYSPRCFSSEVPHKQALLEALLGICWRTKLLQFELDNSDGEIRAIVEWPIEDSSLTWNQLLRAIRTLVHLLDEYYDFLIKAGRTGILSWTDESDAERAGEIQSTIEKLRRLLGQ